MEALPSQCAYGCRSGHQVRAATSYPFVSNSVGGNNYIIPLLFSPNLTLISSTKQPFLETTDYNKYSKTVAIRKLVDTATIPIRATKGSIGFDVKSITPTVIQPGQIMKIPTGLATALLSGMYIRIAPRSSFDKLCDYEYLQGILELTITSYFSK